MIALTATTEWSPSPVIEDTLDLFKEVNIPATFFSTHDDGLDLGSNFERALHPNFKKNKDDEVILDEISSVYDNAIGVRSHSLHIYTGLREFYKEQDIRYESNYLMYGEENIDPFWMYDGVVQFPIKFMDDMWLRRGSKQTDIQNILDGDGLKILAFHPVHIFINSPTIDYYESNKEHYNDAEQLRNNRYGGEGVRDVFKKILKESAESDEEVATLGEIYEKYKNKNPYDGD